MSANNKRLFTLEQQGNSHSIKFTAMTSPCEIIFDDVFIAEKIKEHKLQSLSHLAEIITKEVWRIEDKYSRYNPKSLCSAINNSLGKPVNIDEETYSLLSFAQQCFGISDGLFDITSGVLRKAWRFDMSDNIPTQEQVAALLPSIGWQKLTFTPTEVILPKGMEIDFGGIGKEYAVDKIAGIINDFTSQPALINFGGDLLATKPRTNKAPWRVGIEHPAFINEASTVISFQQGGIATSGDANRFLLKDKKRYGHILNVKTGWPIENAPRSITVASQSCLMAGMIATLAMLQGNNAENFLQKNNFKYWIYHD